MRSIAQTLEIACRKVAQIHARRSLASNAALWAELESYLEKTQSTGCGWIDYWTLYSTIRRIRPREILECGTGVSTLIIASALKQNHAETGIAGRVTSMEEHEEWLQMSKSLLPSHYTAYVDFRLSDTVEDTFSFFRGVRYREIPERNFDFIFVDGPKYVSPVDGVPTFDFDAVHVLRKAVHPVQGLIDKRVSTCFVLQQLLGREKLRYSPIAHLGYLKPSTRDDLGQLTSELSSENFKKSFRLLGRTELRLCSKP